MTGARVHSERAAGRTTGSLYLYAVAVTWPVTFAVADLAPGGYLVGGAAVANLVLWGLVIASVLLWPWSSRGARPDRTLVMFLCLLGAAWLVHVVQAIGRSDPLQPLAIYLPVLLVLVALKPPDFHSATRSLDLFVWSMVIANWCSLVVDLALDRPSVPITELAPGTSWAPCLPLDWSIAAGLQGSDARLSIWGWLGLDGRWTGIFDNPNYLAPFAALMLVYGLTRRGGARIFLVFSGTAFLLLSGSRTSMLAAAAGILALVVLTPRSRLIPLSRSSRAWVAGLILGGGVVVSVIRDPDMNGRSSMWSAFLGLWKESPVWGIGQSGFETAVEQCVMPPGETNAANLVFDSLVRYGLAGIATTLAALAVGLLIAVAAARRRMITSVVLMTVLIAGGLADVNLEWGWPTPRWVGLFVLPALLAWAWNREQPGPGNPIAPEPSSVPQAMVPDESTEQEETASPD